MCHTLVLDLFICISLLLYFNFLCMTHYRRATWQALMGVIGSSCTFVGYCFLFIISKMYYFSCIMYFFSSLCANELNWTQLFESLTYDKFLSSCVTKFFEYWMLNFLTFPKHSGFLCSLSCVFLYIIVYACMCMLTVCICVWKIWSRE